MDRKIIENYAKLIAEVGLNIQKGDKVITNFSTDALELAREVQKEIYKRGAVDVIMNINDDEFTLNKYNNASKEAFEFIPDYQLDYEENQYKNKYCRLSLSAPNPELLKSVDKDILKSARRFSMNARKHLHKYMDAGDIKWCVVVYPNQIWANMVFPNLPEKEALEKLWEKFAIALRLDSEDPVLEWKKHNDNLKKYEKWLDDQDFEKLHYEAPGTDLTVYLAEDAKWVGGASTTPDGIDYMANMPTEEIFTAPHMNKVDGTLRSTKPLSNNGNVIEGMNFEFKEGKVVKFTADKNQDILEEQMSMDEGAVRLGEVALVPNSSPISRAGVVFSNTLFDENASCHFALGRSYAETIVGGEVMSEEDLKKRGANESMIHIDFMVGSDKLNITGYRKNGEKVKVFENGEWAF